MTFNMIEIVVFAWVFAIVIIVYVVIKNIKK